MNDKLMSSDYITIATTEAPCNKQVTRNPDGSLSKTPAGVVYQASAQTIHVPDQESFSAALKGISETTNQTLILGYVPGTEDGIPYQITTKKNLDAWEQDPQWGRWEHGIVDHDGNRYTCRSKKHFTFSSWMVFDKDSVAGMPEHLDYPEPMSWWSGMCQLVPGLNDVGYVFVPSTSSRIKVNGRPAYTDGGWHYYVQVNDPQDINRFGTELLVHTLGTEYGFMRPLFDSTTDGVIGHRPWTIFDPTVFTQERLVFEGLPVVNGEGLSVADSTVLNFPGGRLNTALLRVTDADAKLVEAKTGYKIEMQRNGTGVSCKLLNDSDLHLDTLIETEVGSMTVREFWDSDYDRLRCQAVFRPDSTSMAAYLNRHSTGEPFLFDVGTHTKFLVNQLEVFFPKIDQIQGDTPVAPPPPSEVPLSPFQHLAARAALLSPDDRDQAVQLYLMAVDLGPLEGEDLARHHLTHWSKGAIERAARDALVQRRAEAARITREQNLVASGYALLNTPPDTPMDTERNFLSRFIYIAEETAWHDRLTGLSLKAEGFNHYYRHLMEGFYPERLAGNLPMPRPTGVFSDSLMSVKVDARTYWPGVENEVVTCENMVSLNSWKPSAFQAAVEGMDPLVKDENVRPWLDLAEHLFADSEQLKHILDHMAFIMQHQDIKINHCLLIGGDERIGKDTFFLALMAFIGEKNTAILDAARLEESFADYLVGKKLAVLEEIHKNGYRDAKATENQLKTKLAAPPEVVSLPRKGTVDTQQPNLFQFIIFSNYRDAVHLSSEGGRYYCVWSHASRLDDTYYQELYEWLNDGGKYYVARWLLSRDVTHFNPKAPAPSTEWREEMSSDGVSDLEKEISSIIEEWNQTGRLFFTPQQMKNSLDQRSFGKRPYNKSAVTRALNNLKVAKIKSPDKNRLKIPKIFEEYDGSKISIESFKIRNTTSVYLTDTTINGLVSVENEEVRLSLCPGHMKSLYSDYLKH